MENGLRQGCTVAPVWLNLYACLASEQWSSQVAGFDRVGTFLLYKFDQKLFRRSTSNPYKSQLTDRQFADDTVLHTNCSRASHDVIHRCNKSNWPDSIQKTKVIR